MTESIWKRGPYPRLGRLGSYWEHLPPPEEVCKSGSFSLALSVGKFCGELQGRPWLCCLLVSLPCCSLSACQNNEGEGNAAFPGPERGQPARRPHEYSPLHMAPRIKICIDLKALIGTLLLNTRVCSCCQRASWAWLAFLRSRRWERMRLAEGIFPPRVDWPVTKHRGAFTRRGERMSRQIRSGITGAGSLNGYVGV